MHRIVRLFCFAACFAILGGTPVADAQLRGHGGPVRALAVSSDGTTLLSGSFDTAAIRWSLTRNTAEQVLRFHAGAVNAVVFLADGRAVTGGADSRIAIWTSDKQTPDRVLDGHTGPVASLAASPDGRLLASASWDGTVRLWPLRGGPPKVLEGHGQNVNAVAFLRDGKTAISAGYDGAVRFWSRGDAATPLAVTLPAALNAVAVAPTGDIAAAGADGKVYLLSPQGAVLASESVAARAITALAISGDGTLIAAANIGGVTIIDRAAREPPRLLAAAAGPIWAVAFLPGQHIVLTGGGDGVIRRWNADTGASLDGDTGGAQVDPLAAYAGDPGAQIFRACIACHTLKSGEGERAGPSLHGIFGRRIATLPGYAYSDALKHLDIVWTPNTIAKLFELGPTTYTPGTKMPEQRIGNPEDRAALVEFLERATR